MNLKLSLARSVIDGALADARSRNANPLAVVVLDAGGHLLAAVREDGASLFRFDIARAKATGALGMGDDTRAIAARAASNALFYTTMAIATEGRIALAPGGLLIRSPGQKEVIGSIGISGDTGDVDELCALAGLSAAGLGRV
ncbi:MAG: GlcG/HbpS family heme-binding protein [Janthinobacterium lividum]